MEIIIKDFECENINDSIFDDHNIGIDINKIPKSIVFNKKELKISTFNYGGNYNNKILLNILYKE